MPLPDPELDLLREVLKDDPGAPVFVQVVRELTWRSAYDEALSVARAGIDASREVPPEAWEALARAALEGGQILKALGALRHLSPDPVEHEDQARLRVQILEAAGKAAQARQAAEAFLDVHPQDVVVEAVIERLDAPPPDVRRRLPDPLVSVGRAEAYAAVGRADRAIRVLRRLWFHHPDDLGLRHRIGELSAQPSGPPDDLSEEIDEARASTRPPPGLRAPSPSRPVATLSPDPAEIDTDPDLELTDPAIDISVEEIRRQIEERRRKAAEEAPSAPPAPEASFVYGEGAVDDEEPTVALPQAATDATPGQIERRVAELREKREREGRKRRSLLDGDKR